MIALGALVGLLVAASVASAAAHARTPPAAQALRVCVDRWNQENMVDWGGRVVNVAAGRSAWSR
jgi:hypothetical protein